MKAAALKNPELTSASQNQTHFFEDDQSENMPDNSHMQCNMCVTGLDESLTGEDLHVIFRKYGEIKSAKVAVDPQTSKSKCYGYVWFMNEENCKKAIDDSANFQSSKDVPYSCKLFQGYGLRQAQSYAGPGGV